MYYTGGTYFAFLIAVFFASRLTTDKARWRAWLLVVANCMFCATAGIPALAVLLAISAATYSIGGLIDGGSDLNRRRLLLWLGIGIDAGCLAFFKYAGMSDGSSAGTGPHIWSLISRIGIPLGLSFYTLQSISYLVDVYRRDAPRARSLLEYFCFTSFFPTVVSGPIVRSRQFLPQLYKEGTSASIDGDRALFLIAIGLIKKIAIADYLANNLTARVFDFPDRFSSLEVLIAVYAYALQIYTDFSGFTDIVTGSALLLGISLPENFNAPYRSRSLTEFWRRWHITFSTWLRDYIFFSVTAKWPRKRGVLYAGLILTMVVGGLWHGLGWTFVIWGLLHGGGLGVTHAFSEWRRRARHRTPPWVPADSGERWNGSPGAGRRLVSAFRSAWPLLLTFHFVCLTWIFFRADASAAAFQMLHQLSVLSAGTANISAPVLLVMAAGFAAHFSPPVVGGWCLRRFSALPAAAQAMLLASLGAGLYLVANSDVVPFVYARF